MLRIQEFLLACATGDLDTVADCLLSPRLNFDCGSTWTFEKVGDHDAPVKWHRNRDPTYPCGFPLCLAVLYNQLEVVRLLHAEYQAYLERADAQHDPDTITTAYERVYQRFMMAHMVATNEKNTEMQKYLQEAMDEIASASA